MEQFKMDYFNQNERMNPQLENMLKLNTTDLANNPAFPKTDANGNPINFLELIAYKRFLEVIERVKRYTNLTNVTGQAGMSKLTSMLMQGVNFIEQVEQPHKLALENLAVDLIVEEMEIPDGVFKFQCKIVNRGEINQDGFQKETKQPSEEEINQKLSNEAEAENMTPSEFFEMEKHKRRFINMLIQGSSKKGHYMFELVRNKLNEYNPNLAKTYGEMMSINDLIYWLLDDETINEMASQPSSMAGKEEIEQSEDGTIIKTEAICFPVSLHEIIKGIMETFGTQGLPDEPQQANMVIDAVDSLSNETMDLRLGAIIWEKFMYAYPKMVFDEGNRYLQHYLFSRFCGLETTEFFRVARMIMSNDPKGAKYMERMTDQIISDLNVNEFEENKGDNEDDINIDDLFNYKTGGQVQDLISKGVVELKMFDTKPEHAKEYGLDSVNPLYVQSLCITENQRLKGIGNKVLQYIDDYAIKNGHDLVFGHITQNASFTKNSSSDLCDIDLIKEFLVKGGYSTIKGNNDFYKVIKTNPDIRFIAGGETRPFTDDGNKYAEGGRVKTIKEYDIQVGKKFTLMNGEIIEINRLFIENIDENWVEYSRDGEINENSVNSLKNFINSWRAYKKESGGMAGLSEVSGMLPNPLPMSTIQPMANGGKINSKKNYDVYDNKRMLFNQANEIEHHSEELNEQVKITKQVPAWVIAKMERATTDLSDITHYLDGENKFADGGQLTDGDIQYKIIPLPNKKTFSVVKVTYKKYQNYLYPLNEIIFGFDGNVLEFENVSLAKKFISKIEPKYPYGIPKANAGMLLLASQLLQQKQQQQQQQFKQEPQEQSQIVYYVPKPVVETINEIPERNQDITQDLPLMSYGGNIDEDYVPHSDFCITNLLHLANDIQKIKYYVTHKFDKKDFEYESYKGRLIIIFDEPASINVVSSITKFIERAEDCHHIFEQSTNVSGSNPNQVFINLLIDKFTNIEFGLGGKVYEFSPKKINLNKTKYIKTNDGEFVLGLITEDFVYFINSDDGDENSNTIMYNKKGELLSDNYFASYDLFETLGNKTNFEFIHPYLKAFKDNEKIKNKFKK